MKHRYETRIKKQIEAYQERRGNVDKEEVDATQQRHQEEEEQALTQEEVAEFFEVANLLGEEEVVQAELEKKDQWRELGRRNLEERKN